MALQDFINPEMTPEQAAGAATGAPGVAAVDPSLGRPEIAGMPPAPAPAQTAPVSTEDRMNVYRGLLTNFMWSLGQGMVARSKGRRGAGIGEALLGPWTLEQEQKKLQMQETQDKLRLAQEQRTNIASQEAMNRIFENQQKLPYEIQQLFGRLGLTDAQTDLDRARIDALNNPAAHPLAERISGSMVTARDARLLKQTQGITFQRRDGSVIDVDKLPDNMGLELISGGVPGQARYEIVTQPTRVVTQDNITNVVPSRTPQSPITTGIARVPTVGSQQRIATDPATGDTVTNTLFSTSTPQTGRAAGALPGIGGDPNNPGDVQRLMSENPGMTEEQVKAQMAQAGNVVAPQTAPQTIQAPSAQIVGMDPTELARQRSFATPIKAAASQVFGDPATGFKGLQSYAHLANDPRSIRRLGVAARLIIDSMAYTVNANQAGAAGGRAAGDAGGATFGVNLGSLTGADELSTILKNKFGLPTMVAASQVDTVQRALSALSPEEKEYLNRVFSAYGTVVGLRALTPGNRATNIAVSRLEQELPIFGLGDVSDVKTYYNKLASLATEITNALTGAGISRQVMPERDFYLENARELVNLGQTKAPAAGLQWRMSGGRLVPNRSQQ